MKKSTRTIITTAAIAGLLSGVAINQSAARDDSSTNTAPGKAAPAEKKPAVHDCSGQNDCKGIGGCKTDAHACKFKNDCKGKGGCSITDKDIKNWEKMQADKKNAA